MKRNIHRFRRSRRFRKSRKSIKTRKTKQVRFKVGGETIVIKSNGEATQKSQVEATMNTRILANAVKT